MLYALQHYTLNCEEPVKNEHNVSVTVLIKRKINKAVHILSTEIPQNDIPKMSLTHSSFLSSDPLPTKIVCVAVR